MARLIAGGACLVAFGFGIESVVHADSPATIAVGTNPIYIATTPDGTKAYVSNYSSNSVSVIDIATNLVTATIASVPEPIGIAISPDGTKAYVANYPNSVRTSASITVIDTATNTVTGTIAVGPQPRFIAFSPDGTKAYVAHITTTVSVIDVATSAVATTWTLPSTIYGIVLSPDGSKAYLSRVNSTTAGWVSVVNTSNGTVSATIAVGPSPQTLAINLAGTKVYVPNNGTDRVNTTVSVITTATNAVATVTVGQGPRQVKISPDGSKAYVTNQAAGTVSIINTSTNAVTDTITVGTSPMGIAFSSDGLKAYVTNYSSNTVSILVPAYPVTYSGNGSTGGSAPASGSYTAGSGAYTILGNTGSLTKTGYWFAGWNTAADGSGTTYASSSSYSTAANLTLYARWSRADRVTATVTVGTNPYAVAITPDGAKAYITNANSGNTISIINTATSAVTGSITVGATPVGIAITPDGTKAYVAHFISPVSTVKVIDIASGTVTKTITVGEYAMWVAISPDGTKAYVTNFGDTTVSVINTSTDTVVATINVGGASVKGVAFTPDGTKAYVTRGGGTGAGSISVIDTATNAVAATITAGINAWNLAITPDGTRAYVPNTGENNVDVISIATNTITATIPVGVAPRSVAISPDGTKAFVTNQTAGTTSVIDTASNMVIGTLTVGAAPVGVAFTPDGSKSYVANNTGSSVSVFNWAASTYSIAFNSNGATGGAVPATASYTTGGSAYTVSGNTGSLVKTGSTFSGWNTLANGTGTAYAASSSYSTSATATLYAQWTADALPYSEPFGTPTGSSTGTQASTGLTVGAFATFPNWTKAGSPNPTHWVDVDSGAAVNYAVSLMQSNTLTMTTGLAANVSGTTYRVAYDAGPSTWNTIGEATNATDGLVLSVLRADSTTLQSSTMLPGAWSGLSTAQTLTARCFSYVGDGSGAVKLKIATVNTSAGRFGGAIDNIAIDAGSCPTYSVTYAANASTGGAVPTDAGAYATGASVTVLGNTGTLVRTGYTWAGWNTAADGTGTSYAAAATPSMGSANVTLYATWTATSYAVSYGGNGSTGGSVPASGSFTTGGLAYTVSGNTGTLARTGYTWAGWNTAADGSGTTYADAASYSTSATATLYSQWTAVVTYSVTYAANGATGGAVPTDAGAYATGASVTVLGNTGTLVRTGYAWAGWNTAADGSGTSYAAAATTSMGSGNVTLYARWTVVMYAVSYNANGATGGAVPADAGAYAAGASVTILGNTGTLARTGYTFDGWNTAPAGSGTSYAGGSSLAMGSADLIMYAKWTAVTYVVTYTANGATGGNVPGDGSFTTGGSAYLVPGNTGVLTRPGFVFTGWNTAAGGSGSTYAPASSYSTSANVTLHAQWAVATFGVTYAVNGATAGSAPVDAGAYAAGASATVLGNSGSLARIGYAFATWNTASDGSGTAYAPGAALTMGSAGVIIYAQWTAVAGYSVSYNGNGSTGGSAPADGGSYATGATATVAASGSLSRTGYSFAAWNTAADGSGSSHAGGSSLTMGSSSTTLFANWTAVTYAVTYGANGSTGGAVPADSAYTTGGAALTVPGNSGVLVNAGYTFAGWNTAADGSGSAYAGGSSYATSAAATLHAQWTLIGTYAISFDGNGSTGGSVPASGSYTPGGPAYSVAGNTGSLVRAGYAFAGWNTAAAGSGTAYAVGASYAASSSATLQAQWTAGTYAISFAGNGATGGSAPAGASFTTGGSAFAVPGNSGSLARAGYTFAGWNSAADGSGTAYAVGASLSPVAATTLFGQWTAVPVVSPTPSSSPTAAGSGSSSSSPTPSPSTAAISYSNLNPIPHAANPNIPAAGVPAGGSVVLEDGVPITVTVKPNAPVAPTSLIVSGSGFTMQVEGRSGTAAVAPTVTATGALVLYSVQPAPRASAFGPGVRTSPWKFGAAVAPAGSPQPMANAAGTGFRPGSPVRFYILPSVDMGELTVDAFGAFSGEVPVPMGIAPGAQTLQVNGYSPDGSVRSLSLGVEVRAPDAAIATRQARALVKFGHESATLTKASKSRLRGLVRRTGKDGIVSVTAFARGKELTKKDRALSDARARHVAVFLRKVGLKGSYSVRGVWVVGGPKVTGRRVSVVIAYPRR